MAVIDDALVAASRRIIGLSPDIAEVNSSELGQNHQLKFALAPHETWKAAISQPGSSSIKPGFGVCLI